MTVKAVLMLLGHSEAEANWEGAKKVMFNSRLFIKNLSDFHTAAVPNKVAKTVAKFAKTEEFAATVAPRAAGILTQWVLAVLDARQ